MSDQTACVHWDQLESAAGASQIGGNHTAINTPTWTAAHFGNGLTSSAETECAVYAPAADMWTDAQTLSWWIKPVGWSLADGSPSDSAQHTLWHGRNSEEFGDWVYVIFEPYGLMAFFTLGGTDSGWGYADALSEVSMDAADGEWHRLTIMHDNAGIAGGADKQRVYWDGNLVGSRADAVGTGGGAGTDNITLGAYGPMYDYTNYWQGTIDNFKRFSAALTTIPGNQIYEGWPPLGPDPPTAVGCAAGDLRATLMWAASAGATSYNAYWTDDGTTPSKTHGTQITGVTSPHVHTPLTSQTLYKYVVTAVNGDGESSESTPVVSGTPYHDAFGAMFAMGVWGQAVRDDVAPPLP